MPIHWLVYGHITLNNEIISGQMPCSCSIAKIRMSNVKEFTVTHKMLTAVALYQSWPDVVTGILAHLSKLAYSFFFFFCSIKNHMMTGPLGNSEFCFP